MYRHCLVSVDITIQFPATLDAAEKRWLGPSEWCSSRHGPAVNSPVKWCFKSLLSNCVCSRRSWGRGSKVRINTYGCFYMINAVKHLISWKALGLHLHTRAYSTVRIYVNLAKKYSLVMCMRMVARYFFQSGRLYIPVICQSYVYAHYVRHMCIV